MASPQPTPHDLSARYEAQSELLWASVLSRLASLWRGLGSWRSADVKRFQDRALPIVAAGQRQMASLTASYLEQAHREVFGVPSPRIALDVDKLTGAALRNGADPADVYARPFAQTWAALSKGADLETAVQQGAARLQSLAKSDLQLARTHTSRAVLEQQPRVTYFIRVPEGDHPCALCLVASTQRYHKGTLMPMHPACHCIVEPVASDFDPGQIVNEAKLNAIHAAVESHFGTSDRGGRSIDYRKIVVTHQHGELGPVLGFRGQHFDGPSSIPS